MVEPPDIDGRRRDDIREYLESIAPYYTEEWDPKADDAGTALLATFSELVEEMLTRLDRVPEKQFVAFLDSLGFSRRPPHASRLPLAVEVADDAGGNVAISPGTRAVAESTDERPEQIFEVGSEDGFEATPSNVTGVYSVDPLTDAVFDHQDSLADGSGAQLFHGENQQEHALYVGDADLLTLEAGSTIRVTVDTNAPERIVRHSLVWEYYGETEVDGETITGWHPLRSVADEPEEPDTWSETRIAERFLRKLNGDDRPAEDRDSAVDEQFGDVEQLEELSSYRITDHSPGVRTRHLSRIAAAVRGRAPRTSLSKRRGRSDMGLPPNLLPSGAETPDLAARIRRELRKLRQELETTAERADAELKEGITSTVTVPLTLPGPPVERIVSGTESRWIRCRLPEDEFAAHFFDIEFRKVGIEAGTEVKPTRSPLRPDHLLSNDVPLPADGHDDFHPFGTPSQPRPTWYIASKEAFTKQATTVTVQFDPPVEGGGEFDTGEVSWEYWDGDGWDRLALVSDGTEGLRTAGAVRFDVPTDLEPRAVSGHDGYWIRARIVGGAYQRTRYEETSDGTWELASDVTSPKFGGVRLRYARAESPDHIVQRNNLTLGEDLSEAEPAQFRPFRRLSDEGQTLYIGFDGPLLGGPINVLFALAEMERPDGFEPRLRWEYCTDTEGERWAKLDMQDETRGLRQSGLSSLGFPAETTAAELFGRKLHWIRARVTEDAFVSPPDPYFVRLQREITATKGAPEPYRPSVQSDPSTGEPVAPPRLRNLHLNAGWAYNRRSVTEEILGSSDGSRTQTFVVADPPVTTEGATVWVDELAMLPEKRRRVLAETRPSAVELVTGDDGDPRNFWVQWHEVEDFLGSDQDDRHYTLNRPTGRLTFGDGTRGMIPAKGRDNIRASYTTGGGTDGNVRQHAVTGLKRSIPFVEAVTNPEPAAGGANEESMDGVRRRAPKQLRDRGRSVLPADFERIAMAAAGELARAKCISGMDDAGDRAPGWVTVLVVPNTRDGRPIPSTELKRRVRRAIRDRAPASLVDSDRPQLVVRGPSYVDVSVEAEIEANAVESLSALETRVEATISSFLHPLVGGPEGDGWRFGTPPYLSDLYTLLEGIDSVDHVVSLSTTFEGEEDRVNVDEGDPVPRIAPDTLVFGGTHDITVAGGM